jgi:hypothetical protein
MSCPPALRAAMTLLNLPSQAALIRAGPLPEGISVLLRIAAGDRDLTDDASLLLGCSPELVREASSFFIEQVLLHPDTDSYRVLGMTRKASYPELRHNMTLLLRWLHPDVDRSDARSVFTARVTRAWNDLKTPERRVAYDRSRHLAQDRQSFRGSPQGVKAPTKKYPTRHHVAMGSRARRHAPYFRPAFSYQEFLQKT